jgi:hypothetical protein
MKKFTGTMLLAALLCGGPLWAGQKASSACCTGTASHKEGAMCVDYASLGVTAEQKSKLERWQSDCQSAGCTKESREKFLQQAQGILSSDQYAKLKSQCEGSAKKKV